MRSDIPPFRDFCRIDLGHERAPVASTPPNFRHLIEKYQIGAALFAKVSELLLASGMKPSGSNIVDATLIAALRSTASRDREIHLSKKGNQWYLGMRLLHIGVGSQSGLVHRVNVSAGIVYDRH